MTLESTNWTWFRGSVTIASRWREVQAGDDSAGAYQWKRPTESFGTVIMTESVGKRKGVSEEARKRKQDRDEQRGGTGGNVGAAWTRWRELKEATRCKSDGHLALALRMEVIILLFPTGWISLHATVWLW